MIQRKQSLFLLIAAVLLLVGAFSVSTVFTAPGSPVTVELSNFCCTTHYCNSPILNMTGSTCCGTNACGKGVVDTSASTNYLYSILAVLLFSVAVISVVAILLYSDRKKQMRLCNWSVFVILIYYIARYSSVISIVSKFNLDFNVSVADFMPFVALVLIIMARKAIDKDDKLVRAADRIR